MSSQARLHSMDNLRALAMLAGVVFHAALAYSPLAHPVFPTADRQSSAIVDVFAWFLHLFRMPLFFVVAGYFTALQVRAGIGAMLRSRLLRVGLPFLVFLPLVHAALSRSTLHAARTVAHPSPLLELVARWLQSGQPDGLPPGTGHLWFLYYLLFFCVLVWVARNLGLGRVLPWIAGRSPLWLAMSLPVLLVPALAAVPAPHPAPESLLPQFWAFGYYGPFFVFGWLLHGRPEVLERLRPSAPWLALASVALYVPFLMRLRDPASQAGIVAAPLGVAFLEAGIGAWMTIACLCASQALLARANAGLRYLADASYWTYLVHLPVLFAIQYRLMDAQMHWSTKFALSVLLTMSVCLLGHRLLVQPTPLARVLGRRAPPGPALEFSPRNSRPAAP